MNPSYTCLPDSYIRYLEDQNEKFHQAVDSSPVSVIITDRKGNIEYVNPKFTRITGYSFAEVISKNPRLLKSGQTPPTVYKEMWQAISNGREWSGEFINRKKNGEIYYEYAQISPIKNDKGEITHYVAVKQDITARKRIEAEREEISLFLQNVIDGVPEPVMVINTDYQVILMNAMARETGRVSPDVSSPFCYQVSHKRTSPCTGNHHPCPLQEVMNTRKAIRLEHKHYGPDGGIQIVELIAAPYWGKNGAFKGIIETSRDITERKIVENELEYMAHYDQLTGIPNRILFYDRLERSLALAARENSGVALLFIDLDGFKSINDTYGHDTGDLLLQEVAGRLKNTLRNSDTVGRMGGDEFMAILYGIRKSTKAEKVARKILASLETPYYFDNFSCRIGVSIGISIYPEDGEEEEVLVKKADKAMYMAKKDPHTSIGFCSLL